MWVFLGFECSLDQERSDSGSSLVIPDFYPIDGFIRLNLEGGIWEKDVLGFGGGLNLILSKSNKVEVIVKTSNLKALHVVDFEGDLVSLAHCFADFLIIIDLNFKQLIYSTNRVSMH